MPALPTAVRGAVITGWGTALPPKVLTNKDLEQMVDTSDQWIVERSGIRERHVGGTTIGLSIEAGRGALGMSCGGLTESDALILGTTTPHTQGGHSPAGPAELGPACGACALNAASPGCLSGP